MLFNGHAKTFLFCSIRKSFKGLVFAIEAVQTRQVSSVRYACVHTSCPTKFTIKIISTEKIITYGKECYSFLGNFSTENKFSCLHFPFLCEMKECVPMV